MLPHQKHDNLTYNWTNYLSFVHPYFYVFVFFGFFLNGLLEKSTTNQIQGEGKENV